MHSTPTSILVHFGHIILINRYEGGEISEEDDQDAGEEEDAEQHDSTAEVEEDEFEPENEFEPEDEFEPDEEMILNDGICSEGDFSSELQTNIDRESALLGARQRLINFSNYQSQALFSS